jgi:hypothetical protein
VSLDAKQVCHVLALRDAPERFVVPSRLMRKELADLGTPFVHGLHYGLTPVHRADEASPNSPGRMTRQRRAF